MPPLWQLKFVIYEICEELVNWRFKSMASDILIVDDEADIRELIADILSDHGYVARQAKDSDSALVALAERVPSALVLDIWLHGSELDGLGILEIVAERYPELPVIMISGHGNIETAVSAIKMGAFDFIEKPFKEEQLMVVVRRAIEVYRLKQEIAELKQRSPVESFLVGNSAAVSQLKQAVDKVAPANSRVLITGPAGSGKEVVARMLHQKSRRAGGPFIVLNAASLTPDKMESELFGIEDTTLPAGGPKKIGTMEKAHMGTLFIDEVADMPAATQGKILRVLQDQSFVRVGGNRSVKVDVRIVAATTHDLQAEIQAGTFREDLYYRLNVVPLRVPPLKERREDIPVLCRYFLKRSAEMLGLSVREIADDAVAALQGYEWPGNVRQLRNLMEWLLIMATGEPSEAIRSDALPAEFLNESSTVIRSDLNVDLMLMPLREAREHFEKQYLLAQVNRFGGNISRTSAFIGMERSALHRKLKSLGINTDLKVA